MTTLKKINFLALITLVFVSSWPLAAKAITVGPVKLEYVVDPGAVVASEIFLKNEEGLAKTFYPTLESFTEQDGQKQFTKDQTPLLSWVKTPSQVTLKPGEEVRVPITLAIPEDAPPGGHFAVMWWSTTPPVSASSSEQVAIQVRAGILIYVNVSGAVIENAEFEHFYLEDKAWLVDKPLMKLSLAVKNIGNTYIKPQGEVALLSLFGAETDKQPVNPHGLQILPQSRRAFDLLEFHLPWYAIGPFKLSSQIVYGQNRQVLDKDLWVWVIPWRLILVILAVLVVVIFGGGWGLGRYNRWLISQYTLSASKPRVSKAKTRKGK